MNPLPIGDSLVRNLLLIFFVTLPTSSLADDTASFVAASEFLEKHKVIDGPVVRPANYETLRDTISRRRDPNTKLHAFIFALAGRHKSLLDKEQQAIANKMISARQNAKVNWHDVRNVVRIHAQTKMWQYAAESDAVIARALKSDWDRWTDLRLAYMFQEYVARDRFQRQMWNVYTRKQKESILSGEYDRYVKMNVGHKRLFSAEKQVRRALGKEQSTQAFERSRKHWEQKWQEVIAQFHATSKFERQLEFSMNETDEAFTIAYWPESEKAFRLFAESECDAIRELVQVGYSSDASLKVKVQRYVENLRTGMNEKFGPSSRLFEPKNGGR